MSIVNPVTGRMIKIGGETHQRLVQKETMQPESLEINKKSVIEHSRQTRNKTELTFHKNKTHITNLAKISEQISCSPYEVIEYMHKKHFDQLKIVLSKNNLLVIVDGIEPYIDNIIDDYIKTLGRGLEFYNY